MFCWTTFYIKYIQILMRSRWLFQEGPKISVSWIRCVSLKLELYSVRTMVDLWEYDGEPLLCDKRQDKGVVDWDEWKHKYRELADSGSIMSHCWAELHRLKKMPETPEIWTLLRQVVCVSVYIYTYIYIYVNLCMCVCSYCRHLGRQSVGCSQGLPRQTRQ